MEKYLVLTILILIFVWSVIAYVRFKRQRGTKTIKELKKIIATGKPEVVTSENLPAFAKPNRRARHAQAKIKKQQKKHLDGAALVNKIRTDRDRIRQGEIIEANEFLHILKPKDNGKGKKA